MRKIYNNLCLSIIICLEVIKEKQMELIEIMMKFLFIPVVNGYVMTI